MTVRIRLRVLARGPGWSYSTASTLMACLRSAVRRSTAVVVRFVASPLHRQSVGQPAERVAGRDQDDGEGAGEHQEDGDDLVTVGVDEFFHRVRRLGEPDRADD